MQNPTGPDAINPLAVILEELRQIKEGVKRIEQRQLKAEPDQIKPANSGVDYSKF